MLCCSIPIQSQPVPSSPVWFLKCLCMCVYVFSAVMQIFFLSVCLSVRACYCRSQQSPFPPLLISVELFFFSPSTAGICDHLNRKNSMRGGQEVLSVSLFSPPYLSLIAGAQPGSGSYTHRIASGYLQRGGIALIAPQLLLDCPRLKFDVSVRITFVKVKCFCGSIHSDFFPPVFLSCHQPLERTWSVV